MTARATARRAADNRPYRLISGLPRTARRAAAKRDAIPCDNHPDAVSVIRHGMAAANSQKTQACPKTGQNRRLHRYADPVARGGPLHRSAHKRLFLFHRARRILFLGKTKKRMGGASPVETAPGGRSPHLTPCISPLFFK